MKKTLLILTVLLFSFGFAQEETIDAPFVILEEIPRFPNCLEVEDKDSRDCYFQEMNNHIKENFRYPAKAKKKKIQGRVIVKFIIDREGYVVNIETKAAEGCELLEQEAVRIIKLLPRFKPGIQKDKPVSVSYTQPIMFKLL